MAQNPIFTLAFSGESFTHSRFKECHIERRPIGELVLTSGQPVLCDPAFVELNPFARSVRPGRYPVTVCIVHYTDNCKQTDQRIASTTLHLTPQMPSAWETATDCSVDSAIACFMDADAARILADQSLVQGDSFAESLAEAMDANYTHTRSWGEAIVDPITGLNVIAFSSGWGDGAYTSYWGLDSAGQAVWLLTDFRVLSH
jgi:hypothetical protein